MLAVFKIKPHEEDDKYKEDYIDNPSVSQLSTLSWSQLEIPRWLPWVLLLLLPEDRLGLPRRRRKPPQSPPGGTTPWSRLHSF